MAILLSTGLRNGLATTDSLSSALTGGVVRIYSGPVPSSANADIGGSVLLCEVCPAGIQFEAVATNGVLSKAMAQDWVGTNAATGVASFFRIERPTDTQTYSDSEVRLQGSVGQIGTDLELSNTSLESGNNLSINSSVFSIPERV